LKERRAQGERGATEESALIKELFKRERVKNMGRNLVWESSLPNISHLDKRGDGPFESKGGPIAQKKEKNRQ